MSGWVSSTGWNINLASPGPIGNVTPSTGSFTTIAASSTVTLSGGTASGVLYLDGSKIATSGNVMVFDGANLGVGTSSPVSKFAVVDAGNNFPGTFKGAGGAQMVAIGSTPFGASISGYAANFSVATDLTLQPNGGNVAIGAITASAKLDVNGSGKFAGVVSTAGYTVATLPSGQPTGSRAYVTDALTPVVLTTVTGGGTVVVPVFYNGSAWIVG